MQRPGPLRDLPLERFVSEANLHTSSTPFKQPGSSKRPLSPERWMSSGSKRRVLDTQADTTPRRSGRSSTAPCQPLVKGLRVPVQKPALRAIRIQVFTRKSEALVGAPGHTLSGSSSANSRCTSAPPCSPPRSPLSCDAENARPVHIPMDIDELCASPSLESLADIAWPHDEYQPSYDDHYPGFDVYSGSVDEISGTLLDELSADGVSSDTEDVDKENLVPAYEDVLLAGHDTRSAWSKAGLLPPSDLYGEDDTPRKPTPMTPLAQKFRSFTVAHHHHVTPTSTRSRPRSPLRPLSVVSPTSVSPRLDTLGPLERKRLLADEADGMDWLDDEDI